MTETHLLQLIGLLVVASGLGFLFSKAHVAAMLEDFADHPAHTFTLSILAALGGFLVITFHSNWDGAWTSVLITVIGWIMLVKGLVSLVAAPMMIGVFNWINRHAWLFTVCALLAIAVGGLMTATGFGWL